MLQVLVTLKTKNNAPFVLKGENGKRNRTALEAIWRACKKN